MRREAVNAEQFMAELDRDFKFDRHLQLMICRIPDEQVVGTIYSYNLNRADGHVFITTYIDDAHRNSVFAVRALALFASYLFEEFGLYKIYCEVYSHNRACLPLFEKSGWAKEGVFIGHKKIGNDRSDLVRFTFFASHREKLNRYL
jgi:RimJ/RimL family protein N-acetyltransferase